MSTILTLQIADVGGRRGLIIAATADPEMLQLFRAHVLRQRQAQVTQASDPLLKQLRQFDYDRLKRAMDAVLPEDCHEGG